MLEYWSDRYLRRSYASAQHAEDGCELSPTLSRSESVVQIGNLRGLSCPQEERGLVTEYAFEGSQSGGVLTEKILCVLGPGEEAAPAVLVIMGV